MLPEEELSRLNRETPPVCGLWARWAESIQVWELQVRCDSRARPRQHLQAGRAPAAPSLRSQVRAPARVLLGRLPEAPSPQPGARRSAEAPQSPPADANLPHLCRHVLPKMCKRRFQTSCILSLPCPRGLRLAPHCPLLGCWYAWAFGSQTSAVGTRSARGFHPGILYL